MKRTLPLILLLALLGCILAGCKGAPNTPIEPTSTETTATTTAPETTAPTTTIEPTSEAVDESALYEAMLQNIVYDQREVLWENGEYQVVKERALGFPCDFCFKDDCIIAKDTWRLTLVMNGITKALTLPETLDDYSCLVEKGGRVYILHPIRIPHAGGTYSVQLGFVDLGNEHWQFIIGEDDRPVTGAYMASSNRYAFLYNPDILYQVDLETATLVKQYEIPYAIWEHENQFTYRMVEATDEHLILSFEEYDGVDDEKIPYSKDLGTYRLNYASEKWTEIEP